MIKTAQDIDSDRELLEYVWGNLGSDVKTDLAQHVLFKIEQQCAQEINAGNYDVTVTIANFFDVFETRIKSEHSEEFNDALPVGTEDHSKRTAKKLVYRTIVNELVDRNALLYVYDRQRVRSRVAEVSRYFALLRQRFPGTDYEEAPSLSKMVKLHVKRRKQPKWGDEGTNIESALSDVISDLKAADPPPEFEGTFDDHGWHDAVKRALDLLWDAARVELHPSNEVGDLKSRNLDALGLADYQARALRKLLPQALTAQQRPASNVVTASTGGGKTEAFLFPLLGYALTAAQGNLSGVKGILAYPRQDLCNDQLERLVRYLHVVNRSIELRDRSVDLDPVQISLQHGDSSNVTIRCPFEGCNGRMGPGREESDNQNDFTCSEHEDHVIDFVRTRNDASADIVVTTPDTLHRRVMDHNGRGVYWEKDIVPRFIVLDEVHVYSDQYGMHVANVMRRLQSVIEETGKGDPPVRIAASATISNARSFTEEIFGEKPEHHIHPDPDNEVDEIGWEHIIFVKATEPRTVEIPEGNDKYRERSNWRTDNPNESNVTDMSTMIQVAFALYHTMPKWRYDDPEEDDKDRVLGFVDSIDSVSRLSQQLHNAESQDVAGEHGLYLLRKPDAFMPNTPDTNPVCPKEKFRAGSGDNLPNETAVCEPLPPNPHLHGCSVYEAGECWWTLNDDYLEPMNIYRHKSNQRQTAGGDYISSEEYDDWDLMIATSALEVGFDHESIIGTFQYRAPMSIPGFVQRKGRGGRDADDHPIAVVVLGSNPGDSFYFHHEELLADPESAGDQYLEVILDAENEFVRTQHVVSAIFDYLNAKSLSDGRIENNVVEEVYKETNMELLSKHLHGNRDDILHWLEDTFTGTPEHRLEEIYTELQNYVDSTMQPLIPDELEISDPELNPPGQDPEPFWKEIRIESQQRSVSTDLQRLNKLMGMLSMYNGGDQ